MGTNCPIPPKANYTYKFQSKDQIGTFTYFPSTAMHRASGGFGPLYVRQRSVISVPYDLPDGEMSLLVGDWYKAGHKVLFPFGYGPAHFLSDIDSSSVADICFPLVFISR